MNRIKQKKRWGIKLVMLLLLLPGLLFALIQTPPGKTLLARSLSAMLSRSDHQVVEIRQIKGWIPWDVSLGEMNLGDADGVWLSASDLHCRWMIRKLLKRQVVFRELGAREIAWHRMPGLGDQPAGTGDGVSRLPEMELRVDGLQVDRFYVDKKVAGTELTYSVHSGGIGMAVDGLLSGNITVRGDAEGTVALDAMLRGRSTDCLGLEADLVELKHPTFGLDHISGRASAVINSQCVDVDLEVRLSKDDLEGRMVSGLRYADRELSLDRFQFSGAGFSSEGALSLQFEPGEVQVGLKPSAITVQSNVFTLAGQAAISTGTEPWAVDLKHLDITGWEKVNVTFHGRADADCIELNGRLSEMDVSELPLAGVSNFIGKVNGQLAVKGTLQHPDVVAGVQVDGFKSTRFSMEELSEIDFSVVGGIENGMLFGETVITNYGQGYLTADATMPCHFSFTPMAFRPEVRGMRAELEALALLSNLNKLPWMQNQKLDGVLDTHIEYADEQAEGYIYLTDGAYEHYDLGVVFSDFNAVADVSETGISIIQASATDGGEGQLKLAGGMTGEGLDLRLDLINAWVVRRDEMDAEISGSLGITGPVRRPEIDGTLTINRADIQLDNIAPPPPELLTDYDRNAKVTLTQDETDAGAPSSVGFNVVILMPDQVFVNASMIDAVLGGELQIRDVPEGVSVRGAIQPRRGYVSFIGKKFRFIDGEITMDGSVPPVTMFDNLTAEYSRNDFSARLILSGRAEDPDIRLESTPSMPEDEILSHVLFNRDTRSISAYQAYQIAMAARQLANGLSGPGFMYQIRQAVGVDTLEWREGEEAGASSSVAAGKYITTGLYIEVNRTLEEEGQTGMSAEYEVSRHFSLETYTGPKMRPGIGVNWRKDY